METPACLQSEPPSSKDYQSNKRFQLPFPRHGHHSQSNHICGFHICSMAPQKPFSGVIMDNFIIY